MQELWKYIDGYNLKYMISNNWSVLSLNYKQTKRKKLLKLQKDKDWYLCVLLRHNNVPKLHKVHRLVAKHFINNPLNKETVNHKNWIKSDNNVKNLEWATRSENSKHLYRVLNYVSWLQGKESLVANPVLQYNSEWKLIWYYKSQTYAGYKLKIDRRLISSVIAWRQILLI